MEQCKCSTQIRGLTVRKRDGVASAARTTSLVRNPGVAALFFGIIAALF